MLRAGRVTAPGALSLTYYGLCLHQAGGSCAARVTGLALQSRPPTPPSPLPRVDTEVMTTSPLVFSPL